MFRFIKTTSVLFATLLASVAAYGLQGSQRVSTAIANVGSNARVLANAQITVCAYDAAHPTTCAAPVTVYQDPAMTIPYASTFRADGNGNYSYWATAGNYIEQMCATGAQCLSQPITLGGGGGANLPSVAQVISGKGDGNGLGMPEKGTTVAGSNAFVAWDEDTANGRFDCRNTAYAGGCLGVTPGLAMQALSNAVVCYQATTGKHANVNFPPGLWNVGTAAATTLNLPVGAYYKGASGNYNGSATVFHATYNNVLAIHFANNLSATCSDGNVHTSTVTAGRYEGFGEVGCTQGGCVNAPGDTSNYPSGGPHQDSIKIDDSQGFVDLIGSSFNGGNGVEVAGGDTEVRTVWGQSNMGWYIFGNKVAGQTYNPATDGWHCNVMLTSLDGTFAGPFETYGWLQTPGAEYMHVCGTVWTGGNTDLGWFFSNRDQVGLVRTVGNNNGRSAGGRIDAPMGEGMVIAGAGNSFTGIDNSSACSGFASIPKGAVFGPYIATQGSGQTPGSYDVAAVNAGGDTIGAGGVLTVTIDGTGKATTVIVKTAGTGYLATPTFPFSAAGGTPATIGATVYHHCSKLDDSGSSNSYTGVKNIYESFFGPDFSTGDIWYQGGAGGTFDRGSAGSFERINGIVSEPRGLSAHKDFVDIFSTLGGQSVTGPAVSFTGGAHFRSGDTSPTSWTGPFTVDNIMQDLWIMGGNANTTLPVSAGWQTCSGYDLSLSDPRWYHFQVFQDNGFNNTPFIFREQCDSIDQTHWFVNHEANKASLPPLEEQATIHGMGDMGVHAIPAFTSLTIQAGGIPGANGVLSTNTYAIRVWGTFGTQTSNAPGVTQCLPKAGFINNPCFQTPTYSLPEGWTHYQLFRETSTDATATPGMILEITMTTPQHAVSTAFPDSQIAPINANVIGVGKYSANMTGTWSALGSTIPPQSAYPGVHGQTVLDSTGGFIYTCDTDDHWKRGAITFSNF